MKTGLAQIIKQSFEANCESFEDLVENATQLLSREKGRIGNLNIQERLVKINPLGEALIVGDIHGDLESLLNIFSRSQFFKKLEQNCDSICIFLGDYGDRGALSAEVYYTLLSLKLLFPQQIVLMRGNHEGPEDLRAEPHDLPDQFKVRFGEKWAEAYKSTCGLFKHFFNAAIVEGRYILIHGGLPQDAETSDDLARAHISHPKNSILEEMLWSDPINPPLKTCPSPRGAGKLFDELLTKKMIEKLGVRILIRGHEPSECGFKLDHEELILTLFSRKGAPYFNTYGAYLQLDLSKDVKNAGQLVPFIHKF